MKISVKKFVLTLFLAHFFGIIAGLIASLWWRSAQIKHFREHHCGPDHEVIASGTLPE